MVDRCSTCPATHKAICGSGSLTSQYFIIGERPGQQEERVGRVFIGDAGEELDDLYLPLSGLGRDECWVSNAVMCGFEKNKKPTQAEIDTCARHHLPQELAEVGPDLVILMGSSACSLVDGLDLELQHGIPFKGELFGWKGWMVGMYHPAAGLHRTSLMIELIDDWKRLGKWLRMPQEHDLASERVDYRLVSDRKPINEYFTRFESLGGLLGVDTESQEGQPYSIQVSAKVGTGLMLKLGENPIAEKCLAEWLELRQLVFHNAPADLAVVERLIKSINGELMFSYLDTMQQAYQFQNLPQKLKVLAYRLLHKRRRSWDEVVGPPSKSKLRDWLLDSVIQAESERQVIPKFGKRGQPIKPQIVNSQWERKLTGILSHLSKSETYDPWERITPEMDEKFGRAPRKGVKWCGEKELIEYACSDASDTLELALLFDGMRKKIVTSEWSIMEEDWDEVEAPSQTN